MQKVLSVEVAGRDLLRLEQAARDMGLTPEQLLQQASDAAARPLFSFPRLAPAKVVAFPLGIRATPSGAAEQISNAKVTP